MRSTTVLVLSALATIATASQIQSLNPNFSSTKGCVTASANADNAAVVIQGCLTSGDTSSQNWQAVQSGAPQQIRVFGNKCLDVKDGVNADGTKLQIFTCVDGNTNQLFIPFADNTFLWGGTNKCVDLTGGNTADGNPLQIFTCFPGNQNQQWSIVNVAPPPPTGGTNRLRANGNPTPVCLTAASNVNGDRISLDNCGSPQVLFPGGNDTWVLPAPGTSGTISTFGGTKCLDVTDGNPTNGNLVQIFDCVAGNTNQLFSINGALVTWVNQNKCLDVRDGVLLPGRANIQIFDCISFNTNQQWAVQ